MAEKKAPTNWNFHLVMGDKVIDGEGETALEALQAMPIPDKVMAKGILTITNEGKKKEILFNVQKLRRMFYPSAQPILIKWLAAGLK